MKTDFLFANPSIISGAARILDFGCFFDSYNTSADEEEADAKALYADWVMVGRDLGAAIENYERQSERR